MRVLHVASGDLWGGAEAQIAELLPALAAMPDTDVMAFLMNPGQLASRLKDRGVGTEVSDESTTSAGRLFSRLGQVIRDWVPDIVHTHRMKENVLGGIAAWRAGVPSLSTVHGDWEYEPQWTQPGKKIPRVLDSLVGRHLQSRVVAVSRDLETKLKRRFGPQRVTLVHNGIDVEAVRRAAGDRTPPPPPPIWLAMVGRLVPVKRHDLALRALAVLHSRSPGRFRLRVIGDGPELDAAKNLASDLGIRDQVDFLGFRTDAILCLAQCHGLLMCSDHEGLPVVLLEARALGLPVVSRAVGGIPEVVDDAANARLVKTDSPEDLAAAVSELFREGPPDPAFLDEYWTMAATAKRYRRLYEEILAQSRGER